MFLTTHVCVQNVCVSHPPEMIFGALTSVKHNEFLYTTSIRKNTLLTPPNRIAVLHSRHLPHKLCEDIVCILSLLCNVGIFGHNLLPWGGIFLLLQNSRKVLCIRKYHRDLLWGSNYVEFPSRQNCVFSTESVYFERCPECRTGPISFFFWHFFHIQIKIWAEL